MTDVEMQSEPSTDIGNEVSLVAEDRGRAQPVHVAVLNDDVIAFLRQFLRSTGAPERTGA